MSSSDEVLRTRESTLSVVEESASVARNNVLKTWFTYHHRFRKPMSEFSRGTVVDQSCVIRADEDVTLTRFCALYFVFCFRYFSCSDQKTNFAVRDEPRLARALT